MPLNANIIGPEPAGITYIRYNPLTEKYTFQFDEPPNDLVEVSAAEMYPYILQQEGISLVQIARQFVNSAEIIGGEPKVVIPPPASPFTAKSEMVAEKPKKCSWLRKLFRRK